MEIHMKKDFQYHRILNLYVQQNKLILCNKTVISSKV